MTVSPLKKFGQNFLTDGRVISRIVEASALSKDDLVLEIGPGLGVLTSELLGKVKKVFAIEVDKRLVERLKQEFPSDTFILNQGDFLDLDLDQLKAGGPLKVVANIPYYISTPIVEKLLENRTRFTTIFMTVQYEFALRLTSAPGTSEYGALTTILNLFAEPKILFRIKAGAFHPAPKVESCFLRMEWRDPLQEPLIDEAIFIKVVKQAFLQRRKIISNSLAEVFGKDCVIAAIDQTGIAQKARAEDVSPLEYARLSNHLAKGF